MSRRWLAPLALALSLMATSAMVVSCASTGAEDTKTSDARVCANSAGAQGEASLSRECAEVLFDRGLGNSDIKSLAMIEPARRLKLGYEFCQSARELGASDGAEPLKSDLFSGTAQKWGIDVVAATPILEASKYLCPEDFKIIDALPLTDGPIGVTLKVEGGGSILVEYTGSQGETLKEEVAAPWSLTIPLEKPIELQVKVTGRGSSKLRCEIGVAGKIIAEKSSKLDGQTFICGATADALATAANSPS